MTNPLFIIIPLMIGVFGATITVIFVIRNHVSQKVKDNDKLAGDKIAALKEAGAVSENLSKVEDYRKKINDCTVWVTHFSSIAAGIFGVWIFVTAFYISYHGYCKQLSLPALKHNTTTRPVESRQPIKNSSHNGKNPPARPSVFSMIFFSDITIGAITFADFALVALAFIYLAKADTNYKEVGKVYGAVMAQLGGPTTDPDKLTRTSGQTTKDKNKPPPPDQTEQKHADKPEDD